MARGYTASETIRLTEIRVDTPVDDAGFSP